MQKSKVLYYLGSKDIFLLFTAISLFIFSCKREEDKVGWETEIVTPLLKSSLSIGDLISDTLIQSGSDGLIKVVYENHLYNMSLDTIFDIPDTGVTKIYNLDSISLYNQNITYPISLGQICLIAGPPLSTIIFANNGSTATIPFGFPLPTVNFDFNADTLFQTMTLIDGTIDISITNGFPVDITNVNYDLKNFSNGTTIASGSFPLIAAGATVTDTKSLAGKTIEGHMTIDISGASTLPSAGPVPIDTTDLLIAELSVHDLHPSTATAIFPAQDLVNKSQPFYLKFDSVELKEARLQSGQVVIALYSTLQDSVHFTYSLPSATLNGTPFTVTKTLPPAPPGGTSSFSHSYDFSGYHLDLSYPPQDTVNTMHNTFLARVDSTGQMTTISLTDSFYANISFVGLNPSYGRGYIGQQNVAIGPSQLMIDIFKNLNGTLDLEDVKLSLVAENGIGADAKVDITNITSVNTHTGNSVTLSGSAVSDPFIIQRATDNGGMPPVNVANSELKMDKSNSNSPAFISNLPDKLNYAMSLQTNPGGNNGLYDQFIYSDHLLEFNLNVEMPLSYKANDLNFTLTDTAAFTLSRQDLSRIKDGTLTLNVDNGFPFSVNITMLMLDTNDNVINILIENSVIAPAPVGSNGKVTEKEKSKINIAVDQALINKLFETTKIKISAKYSTTTPANVYYKIYSDYTIDFQLTGDFTYLAHY
jgi:hypothetical protein